MSTILISGANRGLGLEFTRQYADDGWKVIACCRSPDEADELKSIAADNSDVVIEKLDVADHAAIDALGKKYEGVPIDILLNNAGGPPPSVSTGVAQEVWNDDISSFHLGVVL